MDSEITASALGGTADGGVGVTFGLLSDYEVGESSGYLQQQLDCWHDHLIAELGDPVDSDGDAVADTVTVADDAAADLVIASDLDGDQHADRVCLVSRDAGFQVWELSNDGTWVCTTAGEIFP